MGLQSALPGEPSRRGDARRRTRPAKQKTRRAWAWIQRWDDHLVELVHRRPAMSAAAMAKDLERLFKRKFTRSGVAGRVRRMGLELPVPPCRPERTGSAAEARPPSPARRPEPPRAFRPPEPLQRYRQRQAIVADLGGPGIPLLNASEGDCRWPVAGEKAALRVCGEPVATGSSYCPACRKRAYNPAAKIPLEPAFGFGGRFYHGAPFGPVLDESDP
jgi:hypothetical protein